MSDAAVAEKPRIVRKITPDRVHPAEQVVWPLVVNAEPETTKEDLTDTAYWMHVTRWMRSGSRIDVRADDDSWLAEMYVRAVGENWADVVILHFHKLGASEVQADTAAKFEVRHRGHQDQWCIVRKSDNEVIRRGMPTRERANTELTDYMKALRR